ncbi:MAG: DUF3990 domain-containing protein [Sarcina sp.]
MKLIVYHGSDSVIESPRFDGGRKFRDFGLGFYGTTNIKVAKSWSARKVEKDIMKNKMNFIRKNMEI